MMEKPLEVPERHVIEPPEIPGVALVDTDALYVRSWSSVATDIVLRARIRYRGETKTVSLPHTTTSDRLEQSDLKDLTKYPGGVLESLTVLKSSTTAIVRGRVWVQFGLHDGAGTFVEDQVTANLGQDYLYDGHNPSWPPSVYKDPGEGKGFLDWVQEANDIAGNVITTVPLALTNALRVVRQIYWKYHRDGNAATALLTIALRDLADTSGPTGFDLDQDSWISPTLTLTLDERGIIHVAEHGFVSLNDDGVLTYADNSSAPNPFPLTVEEGDTGDLRFEASAGLAGDDYDVFVQYEEWIKP